MKVYNLQDERLAGAYESLERFLAREKSKYQQVIDASEAELRTEPNRPKLQLETAIREARTALEQLQKQHDDSLLAAWAKDHNFESKSGKVAIVERRNQWDGDFENTPQQSASATMRKALAVNAPTPAVKRQTDDRKVICGYAAVTGIWSDLGCFDERISSGAFAEPLQNHDDVRCLGNHDCNLIYGRTSAGTLKLKETSDGLYYECTPDMRDTDVQNAIYRIQNGCWSGCSFSFIVGTDEGDDIWDLSGVFPRRTIKRIVQLFDVGPVSYPAHPTTSVYLRSECQRDASGFLEPLSRGEALRKRLEDTERRLAQYRQCEAASENY